MQTQTSHHFYPELGGAADTSKLFFARPVIGSTWSLQWSLGRDGEAREVFKRLRIRPRSVDMRERIKGPARWACCVTYDAYRKAAAAGLTTTECLLD